MSDRFAISITEEIEDLEFQLEEAEAELAVLLGRSNVDPEDEDWARRTIEDLRDQLADMRQDA